MFAKINSYENKTIIIYVGYISPIYVILGGIIRNDWSLLWQFRIANIYSFILRFTC